MELSDSELLEQIQCGEARQREEAFTALYRRRQPGIYRFALQMTGSVVIAEDVTQETFLVLLRPGNRYDASRGTLASFLFGVARNHVLKRVERAPGAEAAEEAASSDGVLEDLSRHELIEQVRRAVLSLPPQYREVVVLCDLQESSYDEAAAILDCPVGTVRSRLSRGRGLLAQKLKPSAVSAGSWS
jgi:RNA polymerase sigma-70 factor (ECF subfamily)